MNFDADLYVMHSPHNLALGLKLLKFSEEENILEMPFQEKLVGDPETGVIAGGAVTALLDAACGLGVYARLREFRIISTIDLRIDYLRPATPKKSILVMANCHRLTRHVAFVRAVAFHTDDKLNPIAHGNGIFSISSMTLEEAVANRGEKAS